MAPEVIGNNKYSEKADIFSFGVLLVEAYTLNPPYSEPIFAEMTQAQLMYKICHQNLRPQVDGLPPQMASLVEDCWNADPNLRPSFPEIIIRLHRLETLRSEDVPSTGGVAVPQRNAFTYTTFHEMIAPEDEDNDGVGESLIEESTLSRLSINTDDDTTELSFI